jgi:hypothetical protein
VASIRPRISTGPTRILFGKLTWQAGGSSQLELSYNYVKASQDNFGRSAFTQDFRDGWQLNNSGFKIANTTNTGRAKFSSLLGSANLEVLLGYQTIRDARQIPNATPAHPGRRLPSRFLAAGGERFSHGNELDQDNLEATANLTFVVGGNHQITIGTHNEFFKFRNLFANNRFGTYTVRGRRSRWTRGWLAGTRFSWKLGPMDSPHGSRFSSSAATSRTSGS